MEQRPSDFDHLKWLSKIGISSFHGLKILDLGCSSGFICNKAMNEGAQLAVGIDIEEPLWEHNTKPKTWTFHKADLNDRGWVENLNNPSFDFIFAFDIIEHLDSPFLFLKTCHSILNPSGRLVLTTPNVLSWERFIHPNSWSGAKDSQHKTLFTKYSLEFLLDKCGFKNIKTQAPMRSLSFLGSSQPQIGGQLFSVAHSK